MHEANFNEIVGKLGTLRVSTEIDNLKKLCFFILLIMQFESKLVNLSTTDYFIHSYLPIHFPQLITCHAQRYAHELLSKQTQVSF